jgi:hypothetical protein
MHIFLMSARKMLQNFAKNRPWGVRDILLAEASVSWSGSGLLGDGFPAHLESGATDFGTQNGPKTVPKWSQNDTKITSKSIEN